MLGPIFFIIMIRELGKDLLRSVASKYADDTKNKAWKKNNERLLNAEFPWIL